MHMLPAVPTWGMVLEYLIKSSTGHPTTPKGGTKEYRNGPWYKKVYGKTQGDRFGKQQLYGHGAYAGKKMRFTTIEQKWSALKKWYDEKLKDSLTSPNPARNARIEKVRSTHLWRWAGSWVGLVEQEVGRWLVGVTLTTAWQPGSLLFWVRNLRMHGGHRREESHPTSDAFFPLAPQT